MWNELQRQLKRKGLKIREGHIQDAMFIESDLGKKGYSKEKKAEKEGRKVEYTEKQQSHMDKDISFSIKSGQIHHGYKLSTKVDHEQSF